MVSPLSLVVDIHASLAFTGSLDQRPIRVHNRFLKELRTLLPPDRETRLIEDVHQAVDFPPCEPAAEVTRSCRIRNSSRSQSIKVDFIIAA